MLPKVESASDVTFVASLLRMVEEEHGLPHPIIDGPYSRIHELDGFRVSALRSRSLGYDGKWVLHPGQIAAAPRRTSGGR